MKPLNFITRTIAVAILVVSMSTTLEAQKAYRSLTLENGIAEINNMANRLIEKCKIKFEVKNTATVSELESAIEASPENELNGMINQLSENVKFDVNQTYTVVELNDENSELSYLTDTLITCTAKFDLSKTNSIQADQIALAF